MTPVAEAVAAETDRPYSGTVSLMFNSIEYYT